MSIPKDTAQADTTVTHDAAEVSANTILMADIDAQIERAIAQGVSWISASVADKKVNPKTVSRHYLDLGYSVEFLDVPSSPQAAVLFGQNYVDFWLGRNLPPDIKMPYRIKLGWK